MKDLHRVIQTTINRMAEAGLLEWPSNIPSSQLWVEVIEDKGGGTTKLVLKILCSRRADSVNQTVLLAMLDRASDKYDHLRLAFGETYQQLSDIKRRGLCVYAPWRQRLPDGFAASPVDQCPVLLTEVEVKATKLIARRVRNRRESKTPKQPKPSRQPATPLSLNPPKSSLDMLMASPASPPAVPRPASIPSPPETSTVAASDQKPALQPQPLLSRPSSPVMEEPHHQRRCRPMPPLGDSSDPDTATEAPASTVVSTTPAASSTTSAAAEGSTLATTADIQCVEIPDDPNAPPTEERPDCWACSRPWGNRTSGRYGATPAAPA